MATLKLDNVTKMFGGVRALDGVSARINRATINAIIGPNGSGKTTLFNVITGFLRPDSGSVVFRDGVITHFSPHRIARRGVGRTFQVIRIFPQTSVMEDMLLALETRRKEGLFYGLNPFIKYRSGELEKKAKERLRLVELEDKVEELSGNLSHGQRRLLEIMRTLALDAELYLFDEPTAGVFPEVRERILKLFRELKSQGKTVIFIEHNMDVVREVADRVIVLDRGRVIADGTPEEALEKPEVIEAYFGGADVA